jgi:hypothetical protein
MLTDGADNSPMHGIVTHVDPKDPKLLAPSAVAQAWLQRGVVVDQGVLDRDAYSLAHERVGARALGLPAQDGLTPWWVMGELGPASALRVGVGVGLISPVHVRVGMDHVSLIGPSGLALGESDSRAVFETLQAWLQDAGWRLEWLAPDRWRLEHPDLALLRTAALARVEGDRIDAWPPTSPDPALVRRWKQLQNELQMLLHTHPVNDERAARGLPPVNSVWLSGTGAWPEPTDDARASVRVTTVSELPNPWAMVELMSESKTAMASRPLERLSFCTPNAWITVAVPTPTPTPAPQGWRAWFSRAPVRTLSAHKLFAPWLT